ncbi:MAG: response regulator transcription factor [Clostridia bacterium]|nr:response regulator transcription factor [Clostridia bacterium]
MSKIKVLVVDDQPIVRDGLKMVLSLSSDIEVVGTAAHGEEALMLCENQEIDVVLMDIRMPMMDGVQATKLVKEKHPKIKVIILTTFNDDEFIFDALKNGASSYLLKDMASEEIINTIKIIYSGGTVLHSNIAAKVMDRVMKPAEQPAAAPILTQRETEIAKLIAEGLSNKEIAGRLYITEGTAKNHITNILSKLGLEHRTQIALYVIENKLV